MSRKLFLNLPVKDLPAAIEFFEKLGFSFNPQFTDETAACMIVSEHNFVMLLTHEKFKEFVPHPICDAGKQTEMIVAVECENRAEVDTIVDTALAAGAHTQREPMEMGFMYLRSLHDLDNHLWEFFWMDPTAMPPQG